MHNTIAHTLAGGEPIVKWRSRRAFPGDPLRCELTRPTQGGAGRGRPISPESRWRDSGRRCRPGRYPACRDTGGNSSRSLSRKRIHPRRLQPTGALSEGGSHLSRPLSFWRRARLLVAGWQFGSRPFCLMIAIFQGDLPKFLLDCQEGVHQIGIQGLPALAGE